MEGRKKMEMIYVSGPQSIDIRLEGITRSRGVGFFTPLERMVYGDDMALSMVPFYEQGSLLMCPSNAQEEVKKLVRERNGFLSEKRSTEAVTEFLTKVYPNQYRSKHQLIHSIYFDKDGVLWEEERLEQNLPFFKVIADYIRTCQGPYTAHPPISIATGAAKASLSRVLGYIGLNKENIPAGMSWPPIIFEEGCLALNPITGEILDLTEEKYGLFPLDFRKTILLIAELGKKINERIPGINEHLGLVCKTVLKERGGYTLSLPLKTRGSRDDLRGVHSVIYRNIRDLFPEDIEFAGLFTEEELRQGGNKK